MGVSSMLTAIWVSMSVGGEKGEGKQGAGDGGWCGGR